jgi:hypothetical protein
MGKPKKRKQLSFQEKNGPAATYVSALGFINTARKYLKRLDVGDNTMVTVLCTTLSRLQLMRYGVILVYLMSLKYINSHFLDITPTSILHLFLNGPLRNAKSKHTNNAFMVI